MEADLSAELDAAVDEAAKRFMGYVKTGCGPVTDAHPEGEPLSLKEQKELFGTVRAYQDARKKAKVKDGPEEAPGFSRYQETLDKLVELAEKGEAAREAERERRRKRRLDHWNSLPTLNGVKPPPLKQGRPTKDEVAHRAAYAAELIKLRAGKKTPAQPTPEEDGLASRMRDAGLGDD